MIMTRLRYHSPLSPDEQIAQGIATPQRLAMADKVRFSELDVLNHVNNKAYMSWFESLRVAYSDLYCRPHFEPAQGPRVVLRNSETHYIREMVENESYIATAQVIAFRTTSYTMRQQIWSGNLRAEMICVIVFRTPDGSAGSPLPDSLRQQFIEQDGAQPAG
jgi:acyl-CoA thioester hydrolase